MKLVTFELATPVGAIRRVGAMLKDHGIVDLRVACATRLSKTLVAWEARARAEWLIPLDMVGFLDRGADALAAAADAIDFADAAGETKGLDRQQMVFNSNEARLLSPLPRPTSIRDFSCIEEHYLNAIRKLGFGDKVSQGWYDWPPYYKGNPLTVIGPEDDVIWPSYATEVDYELEVALVIGKRGKDISLERAREHIAGFTIFNDISIRNVQPGEQGTGVGLGKCKDFDTGNIFGPCIVTPDEFDGRNARAIVSINGEVRSEGNVNAMYHSWEKLIAHASQSETLYPGEIFASGSLGRGSGIELGRYLAEGDVMEFEVEGIGILRNRLIRPA